MNLKDLFDKNRLTAVANELALETELSASAIQAIVQRLETTPFIDARKWYGYQEDDCRPADIITAEIGAAMADNDLVAVVATHAQIEFWRLFANTLNKSAARLGWKYAFFGLTAERCLRHGYRVGSSCQPGDQNQLLVAARGSLAAIAHQVA